MVLGWIPNIATRLRSITILFSPTRLERYINTRATQEHTEKYTKNVVSVMAFQISSGENYLAHVSVRRYLLLLGLGAEDNRHSPCCGQHNPQKIPLAELLVEY
jgi:hypothetical protein